MSFIAVPKYHVVQPRCGWSVGSPTPRDAGTADFCFAQIAHRLQRGGPYAEPSRDDYFHLVTDASIQRSGSASCLYLPEAPTGRLSKSQCNQSGIGRRGLEYDSSIPSSRYAEVSASEASSSGSTITRSPGAGPSMTWHQTLLKSTQGPSPAGPFGALMARVRRASANTTVSSPEISSSGPFTGIPRLLR